MYNIFYTYMCMYVRMYVYAAHTSWYNHKKILWNIVFFSRYDEPDLPLNDTEVLQDKQNAIAKCEIRTYSNGNISHATA